MHSFCKHCKKPKLICNLCKKPVCEKNDKNECSIKGHYIYDEKIYCESCWESRKLF